MDFPIKNGRIFHSFFVRLPEGIYISVVFQPYQQDDLVGAAFWDG